MATTTQLALDQESLLHGNRTRHVLDLPYDILYLIITFICIDPSEGRQDFPVVVSHVCHLWRQYALDTPGFWTSLRFKNPTPEIQKYHTWLERSKDSPFDLEIGRKPFDGASIKHAKAIMRLIFPHVQRLRSLHVSYVPFKIRQVIFDRLNNVYLPSLETLDIKRGWGVDEKPSIANRKFKPFFYGDAANLKHAVLKRVPYDYHIQRFTNLETLSIVTISGNSSHDNAKTVQDILSRLPDLRTLRIHIEGEHRPDPQSVIPVVPSLRHSSLEELYLRAPRNDVNTIVCTLVLPSLHQLRDYSGTDISIDISCLPALARCGPDHPYPNLLDLRLRGQQTIHKPISVVDLRNMEFLGGVLEGMSQLQSLTLICVNLGNKHLTCLTKACPRLRRLVFHFCSGLALKELRAMIQSRRGEKGKGSSSLDYVCIEDWRARVLELQSEAKDHGLGGDPDFNITSQGTSPDRIVVIGTK